MSKSITALLALGLLTLVAACAQQEEVIFVEPEPIEAEPVTGKF
ncbi:MAG: hypothetical protein AAF871_09635 [Pseudomonadota bacterium]